MIQSLENLPKIRVKLTIPLVASYLSKRYRVTDIARICNQSHQWVSEFIQKNCDELLPLIDDKDIFAAMQAKHIAQQARNKLENIFDTCKDFNKKDLIPLTAVSDRHTQQYRLLSDKSTENVSMDIVEADLAETQKNNARLRARIAEMDRGAGMGNEEVIGIENG